MVSLWRIFWVFAKIGAFTIGGGIPMIVAIKSELVDRKWLNNEDFIDIITLAQTAPENFIDWKSFVICIVAFVALYFK